MSSTPGISTDASPRQSLMRGLALVCGVAVLAGGLLAGPAWATAGATGLQAVLAAVGLCLVPGLIVVLIVALGVVSNPFQIVLASTGLRLTCVLGVVLVVRVQRPELTFVDFYLWVVLVYMATLAVETRIVSRLIGTPETSTDVKES